MATVIIMPISQSVSLWFFFFFFVVVVVVDVAVTVASSVDSVVVVAVVVMTLVGAVTAVVVADVVPAAIPANPAANTAAISMPRAAPFMILAHCNPETCKNDLHILHRKITQHALAAKGGKGAARPAAYSCGYRFSAAS